MSRTKTSPHHVSSLPAVLKDSANDQLVYEYGKLAPSERKDHLGSWDRLNQVEEHLLREVPPRLRQALSRELEADLSLVEEGLRKKATTCVKTLISDVFQEIRESMTETQVDVPQANESHRLGGDATQRVDMNLFHELDFDFLDAFTMLGDEELRYDEGGLLDNILQPAGGIQPSEGLQSMKKLSDSGYESNSSDGSCHAGGNAGVSDETAQ